VCGGERLGQCIAARGARLWQVRGCDVVACQQAWGVGGREGGCVERGCALCLLSPNPARSWSAAVLTQLRITAKDKREELEGPTKKKEGKKRPPVPREFGEGIDE